MEWYVAAKDRCNILCQSGKVQPAGRFGEGAPAVRRANTEDAAHCQHERTNYQIAVKNHGCNRRAFKQILEIGVRPVERFNTATQLNSRLTA